MIHDEDSQKSFEGNHMTTNKCTVDPKTAHEYFIISNPVVTWNIYVFGKDKTDMVIRITSKPSWYYRFITSLIFRWYWVKAPI
jgi:hypothetical protein